MYAAVAGWLSAQYQPGQLAESSAVSSMKWLCNESWRKAVENQNRSRRRNDREYICSKK